MAIELYDGSLLVGRSKVLNDLDFTPIIAWQGSVDYGLPGFAKGHQIHCRVLNVEGTEVPVTCLEPYQYYGEGAFTELTLSLKEVALPGQFKVGAPFPNPFNPATTLVFELPANGIVGIIMYNTLGQVISRSQTFYKAGQNTYVFNAMKAGNELVSGVYFVQLQYRDQIVTRKLLLMK